MIAKLRLSFTGSRVALIQYSTNAVKEFDFNTFKTTVDLSRAVEGLVQQGGQRRIDKALKMTYNEFYSDQGSARNNVQHIVFVLTDGRQTPDPNAVALNVASESLRNAGVYIIAIGVGDKVDRGELRLMTETDQDVYLTSSFNDLLKKVPTFSSKACRGEYRPLEQEKIEIVIYVTWP